jgi:hypothetical protein
MQNSKLKLILPAIFACVFFVLAGKAEAATYYADSTCARNGNGLGSGCAAAANGLGAYNTLASLNSRSYSSGDDIYLKDGVTFSGVRLTPNISGTPNNQSIIGTYRGDGQIGKSAEGAVLNGGGTFPSSVDAPLVRPQTNCSYVTIQDLHIINSGGRAIEFAGGVGNKIINNIVHTTYGNGIQIMKGTSCSDEFEISGNYLYKTCGVNAGGAINVVGTDSATPCANTTNGVVRNNYIQNSDNEGIDIIKGAVNIIVEDNTVINSNSPNIYFDRNVRNSTIRRNLIYGYAGQPKDTNAAISLEDEGPQTIDSVPQGDDPQYAGSQGNKVHSNVVVNARQCLTIGAKHYLSTFKDNQIFNNTCIDSGHQTTSARGANFASWDASPAENSNVKNNISWITLTPFYGTAYSAHSRFVAHPSGLVFSTNLFNGSQTVEASVKSTSDPGYPTYPNLNTADYFVKGSGWNVITAGSITRNDFKLKPTAIQAIDKGAWLTAVTTASGSGNSFAVAVQYFTAGDEIQFQGILNRMKVVSINNLEVTVDRNIAWTQNLGVALAYNGAKPDIGAHEYVAGDTQAPASPGGLSVR